MKKQYFITETKYSISSEDFVYLRTLYTPVIGQSAVMLYSLLTDYNLMNVANNGYTLWKDLAITLGVTEDQLSRERQKLEAVGLIRTFEKSNNQHFIIMINKPLTPSAFKRNSLLFKETIKKIGELIFERVEFAMKPNKLSKEDFAEVTTKYPDLFSISPSSENKEDVRNTLEIAIPSAYTKEEAIKSLTFSQFIKFLTNKKISDSQLAIFSAIHNQGLSSKSLNLILDYSFITNGRIVGNHVKKIADDFIKRGITTSLEVQKELAFSKKETNTTNTHKNDDVISEMQEVENSRSWDDIIGTIGGL